MPRDPMEPYVKLHDGGIDLLSEDLMPFVFIPWAEVPENSELIALHEASVLSCIAEQKGAR